MKTHDNKKHHNHKAFSLIELIFVIVVIGIIASVAIPKLMGINSKAKTSTVSSDVKTIVSSIQSYYVVNKKIDKISDSVNINSSVWSITDKEVIYKENDKDCVKITVDGTNLNLTVDETAGEVCAELVKNGIKSEVYPLN
jgi:general secretion pathway protein G